MRRLLPGPIAALVALAFATSAGAAPEVRLLEPAPGACVDNGQGVIDRAPEGEPFIPPADLPLRLELSESEGAPLTVVVRVDGEEVQRDDFVPAAAGVAEQTERFFVPAESVIDGPNRRIEVEVSAGGVTERAEVTVDVDRVPPDLRFEPEDIEVIGVCAEGEPPEPEPEVADALDPNPTLEREVVREGCRTQQIFTAVDDCGNGARVVFSTRAPAAAPPTIRFAGVEEGARVRSAVVEFAVEAPVDCVEEVTALLRRNDGVPAPLVPGARIDDPGDYVATVSATLCGGQEAEAERSFTVLPPAQADPGGPYVVTQGEALLVSGARSAVPPELGAIVEYAWDINNDGFFDEEEGRAVEVPFDTTQGDGDYRVGLRITTDQGFVDFGYTDVSVLDVDPVCDPGGPYEIEQGRALEFDGSGSGVGHESDPLVAYDWDFGDDRFPERGLNPTPNHRYQDEGEFTVTLRIEDIDSFCEATAQVTVLDVEPEIRNLRARDADALVEGEPVVFTAAQTSAGSAAEPLVAFRWDFGDGDGAEGEELRGPTHVYQDDGRYDVCLEVDDIDSTARECFSIRVADLEPFARIDGPRFIGEGEVAVFDALGSRAGGAADPLSRYEWDFGDGTEPVVVEDLAQTAIEHRFQADGRITVTLTVHDEDSSTSVELEVFVDDVRPTPDFEGPALAFEGAEVAFDASPSEAGAESDPIVEWRWSFGDGGTAEGEQATHSWGDEGFYPVRLTVIDEDGSQASVERFLEVRNAAPTDVRVLGPQQPEIGVEVEYTVEWVDVPDDVALVRWRMGDGTVFENTTTVRHAYAETGFFTIRVSIDDQDGGETTEAREIEVTGAAPTLTGPEVVEGEEGAPLAFAVEVESAPTDEGFDGPVDLRVPVRPQGLEATVVDGEAPQRSRRVEARWTPGQTDAGEHVVRVVARSPAGIERSLDVRIEVRETGRAVLVAAHSEGGAGRVTVYAFDRDAARRVDTFRALDAFAVGQGTGGIAPGPDGRRAFVAVPGAGRVAAVQVEPPRLLRRIPVEGAPFALATGPEHVWAFDAHAGVLTAIDPVQLKRAFDVRLGQPGVADATWHDGRLLAVSARSGRLLVIDPEEAARAGGAPVERVIELGGRPQRLLVDGDRLVVADATRRLLFLQLDALDEGPTEVVPTRFAPTGLAVADGALWVVADNGLSRYEDGALRLQQRAGYRAVAALPGSLLGTPALALGTDDRVVGLPTRTLDERVGVRGGGARRLLHFVAPR